jgi:hypothetical protein
VSVGVGRRGQEQRHGDQTLPNHFVAENFRETSRPLLR